jgi:hypothetical protein
MRMPSVPTMHAAARTPSAPAALTILLLVVAGCGDEPRTGVHAEWTAERAERGDTLVVRTLEGSVWGDTMVLVPRVAIGELEGAEPYVLGNPGAVDLAPHGRIYVADRQAREVRVFDGEGRHLFTFGREGGGPGEFSDPDDLRLAPDGRVIVRDQRGARFSVFGPDGEFIRSWPLPGGFMTSTPFHVARDGRVFHPTLTNPGASLSDWRMGLVVFDPDGTPGDTLEVPSRGYEAPYLELRTENSWMRNSVPFTPREQWSVLPDGDMLFGLSDRYRWERWKSEGGVLAVERVAERAPVLGGEASAARTRVARNFTNADPSWRWRGQEIPDVKPAFGEILGGADGSVWVLRPTEAREEENPDWDRDRPDAQPRMVWVEPVVYDVFDGEGRYMGPVRFPDEYVAGRRGSLTLERVLIVVTHDFGHEQVVLHELAPRRREPEN